MGGTNNANVNRVRGGVVILILNNSNKLSITDIHVGTEDGNRPLSFFDRDRGSRDLAVSDTVNFEVVLDGSVEPCTTQKM